MEIENFTGKSVLPVFQDFHARIFSKDLITMLAFPKLRDIEQQRKNKKASVPAQLYAGHLKNE
jgi:hypothetical protein